MHLRLFNSHNRTPLNTIILALVCSFFLSCSANAWNADLVTFVDTGLSTAYLDSSTYIQAGLPMNADVMSGKPVTVTVRIANPKAIDLAYSLGFARTLLADASTPKVPGTGSADAGFTTTSFTFTPTESAEHGRVSFSLGLACLSLNKTFNNCDISVTCDSPPDPVNNLTAGINTDYKATIAFTLPENYSNADIAAVEITYSSPTAGTNRTITEAVSPTGTGLATVAKPALLNGNAGLYIRYFFPSDVIAKNPYTFTVVTIDSSGKRSTVPTNPASVSITGNETFLGYDSNGGQGAIAAQFGFNGTTTVKVSGGTLFTYPHFSFTGWNTSRDGLGTPYSPGDDYTFTTANTTLYAQWLPLSLVDIIVNLSEPIYATLTFNPSKFTVQQGSSLAISPGSGSPTSSDSSWAWSIDGTPNGVSTPNFTWDTTGVAIGSHSVSCAVAYGGITYSGTVIVTVTAPLTVSYDGNGNTAGSAPPARTFEGSTAVSLAVIGADFRKSGYAFAGWATSESRAAAGTVDYANGATTGTLTANLHLFAVWNNVAPDPVTSLAAIPGDRKVTLSWMCPSTANNGDLSCIRIGYTDGAATGSVTVSPSSRECTIKGLVNFTDYTFDVRTVDAQGASSVAQTVIRAPIDVNITEVIAAGTATFAQTESENSAIGPITSFNHRLSAFRLGTFEVTCEQWYTVWKWAKGHGYSFSADPFAAPTANGRQNPVTGVSWGDCVVWCNALSEYSSLTPCYYTDASRTAVLRSTGSINAAYPNANVDWEAAGYRLPTEAEWVYAASDAGTTPWNCASGAARSSESEAIGVAWGSLNSGGQSHPVGTLKPNSFGLFDMSGNAGEWVWDWHAAFDSAPRTDYRGPDSGDGKLLMGGDWTGTYVDQLRLGVRRIAGPSVPGIGAGFRVCRTGGN